MAAMKFLALRNLNDRWLMDLISLFIPQWDGVVFVGKAQEKCTVYRTEKRHNPKTKRAYAWIVKSAALVNHYYFDANQPARLLPADPPARGFTSARPLLISSMNMIRRSFLETMGAAGALAGAGLAQTGTVKRTGIYLLEIYDFKAGTQPARFHNHMSKSALPALGKVHSGPKLVMDAVIAPHSPQSMVILGFQSVEELWSVHAKVSQDRELEKASEEWQAGAEPPFEQQTNMILEATSFSPEIVPLDPPPKAPRLFELRVYHSPTRRQLQALEERFAGPEIRIFHRVGVHPILYGSTVIGPNMPNLTYVIPFDDLAAREKAWSAFGADEEWAKVRQESVEKSGQISNIIQISIYQATTYSPIR